jgi:hypothetical protein
MSGYGWRVVEVEVSNSFFEGMFERVVVNAIV